MHTRETDEKEEEKIFEKLDITTHYLCTLMTQTNEKMKFHVQRQNALLNDKVSDHR